MMVQQLLRCFGLLVCLGFLSVAASATPKVTFSIRTPGKVTVEIEYLTPTRSWSFRNSYAGVLGIAERVDTFRALLPYASELAVRKSAPGEFRTNVFTHFITYTVKLSEPRAAAVSHTSWLAGDCGFLMLADLLPVEIESLSAEFIMPTEWSVASSLARGLNGRYQVARPEKTVFFVGRWLRKTSAPVEGMMLETVLCGTWPFKDKDVSTWASKIIKKYQALTAFGLPGKPVIMIAPLPVSGGNIKWKAETRGSTVVLLIDPNAEFRNWEGQLSIIFTHELLHLWVPNSLKLDGDYDWFFEGFTLYTALRTALELKHINFKEFLRTLARVYDSYLSYGDERSLIDASERRWTSPASLVYDKGMLVAFLYDLMVRKESRGRITLAAIYRDLFNGRVADETDGNEAIIRVLGSSPAGKDFVKSYVEDPKEIKLEELLPAYGLQVVRGGKGTELRVSRELNEEQKHLLRSLGYRN